MQPVRLLRAPGPRFQSLHYIQFLDVVITFFNYGIQKLIMMQQLEPRTAGLKPTKIGYVDRLAVVYKNSATTGLLSSYYFGSTNFLRMK